MVPCPDCRRHLRESELRCPFCGADVHATKISADACLRSLGAFALSAFALLGSVSCSKDGGSTDGNTTTNGGGTSDESTTVDDASTTAMTETSTDTDDDPTASTSAGGSFYAGPDIDFGSPSSCDPWTQDCPDGEKCVPYASSGGSWDANKCVPITGDGKPGDPCTYGGSLEATDDCDATSICWDTENVDGQQIGTCTPLCTGTPDEPICDEGSVCSISNRGSINVCLTTCDPLVQDCDAGDGCYWTGEVFVCVGHFGDLMTGEPCGYLNDCPPGDFCTDESVLPECAGSSCCASYCSLAQPSCPDGTACVSFFAESEAPPQWADVGLCVLPP